MANQQGKTRSLARREAVDWFVRQDGRTLDDIELSRFQHWLQQPQNAYEYARVEALWGTAGPARTAHNGLALERGKPVVAPGERADKGMRRHHHRLGIGASLAACLLLAVAMPRLWLMSRADVITQVGETKSLQLPDGSTVVLNTDSALAWSFTTAQRRVRLLSGEAFFDVASDGKRPFVIEAAGGATRALGTRFTVHIDDAGATVTGMEHEVSVTYPADSDRQRVIGPGRQVTYGRADGSLEVTHSRREHDAWRRGKVWFENRPLSEVIEELNRYHRGHLRLVGDELKSLPVNGVFSAYDTVESVDALLRSLQLDSTRLGDRIIFIHR